MCPRRPDDAAGRLRPGPEGYRLSQVQAQEILDLRLQRLTGLEQDKIINEYQELLSRIASTRKFSPIPSA
jgi:DNA gyrase subunit A